MSSFDRNEGEEFTFGVGDETGHFARQSWEASEWKEKSLSPDRRARSHFPPA